jgi:hypothetical protein
MKNTQTMVAADHERNYAAGRETRIEVLYSADLTANHPRKW